TASCGVACFFFFFQAEDGIRDFHVTGVQTCALPISPQACGPRPPGSRSHTPPQRCPTNAGPPPGTPRVACATPQTCRASIRSLRSEERRVGKECRAGWSRDREKRKGGGEERVGVRRR